MKRIWTAAPWATAVLTASVLIAGVFALRTVTHYIYWSDPEHQAQTVEGWMTPGYVAHSWSMPRRQLLEALHIPSKPEGGKPRSLKQIADSLGLSEDQLIQNTQDVVNAYTAQRGSHE